MAGIKIQQGELAHWLQVIAEGEPGGVAVSQVPAQVVESLQILRCIQESPQGTLLLTDKGRLAIRMQSPGALHLQ